MSSLAKGMFLAVPRVMAPPVQEANDTERVRSIDAELLFQKLRSNAPLTIVDVRSAEDFRGALGRIASACSLPLRQLAARRSELDLHRSTPVVVVSNSGVRSRLAALELELAGFQEVESLEGGMLRWRELGYPTEGAIPARESPSGHA